IKRHGVQGGRWYIIGELCAQEVRESHGAREVRQSQVDPVSPPEDDQTPSVLQQRARILEMSSVFSELSDGSLRALARRMRPVPLGAGETLRLSSHGGDLV